VPPAAVRGDVAGDIDPHTGGPRRPDALDGHGRGWDPQTEQNTDRVGPGLEDEFGRRVDGSRSQSVLAEPEHGRFGGPDSSGSADTLDNPAELLIGEDQHGHDDSIHLVNGEQPRHRAVPDRDVAWGPQLDAQNRT
jgi:hypothetical protein